MEKVIPIFYTEYFKYISRFRVIPNPVDCLTVGDHIQQLL